MDTTKYSINIPNPLHKRLKTRALSEDRSAANIIRRLIEDYLDNIDNADTHPSAGERAVLNQTRPTGLPTRPVMHEKAA